MGVNLISEPSWVRLEHEHVSRDKARRKNDSDGLTLMSLNWVRTDGGPVLIFELK